MELFERGPIAIEELVEKTISEYEERVGELPAHNKSVLRSLLRKEFDFWDKEEGRVLNDSHRFPED